MMRKDCIVFSNNTYLFIIISQWDLHIFQKWGLLKNRLNKSVGMQQEDSPWCLVVQVQPPWRTGNYIHWIQGMEVPQKRKNIHHHKNCQIQGKKSLAHFLVVGTLKGQPFRCRHRQAQCFELIPHPRSISIQTIQLQVDCSDINTFNTYQCIKLTDQVVNLPAATYHSSVSLVS